MTAATPNFSAAAVAAGQPMPKLLLVGSALSGGGAETRLRLLAQHMFGGTADVAVFTDTGAHALNAPQRIYPLGWAGRNSYLRVVLNLRKALKTGGYDAAISMGLHQNATLWTAAQWLRERPALIMTETTRPDTNGRLDTDTLTYWVRRQFYRQTYPAADLVAANSIDGVAEVVSCYGVDEARIRRIPNVIERDRLLRLSRENNAPVAAGAPPSFCMVTRLDQMKKVETLLEAAAGVHDLPWRIDIVGDGPHRGALEALAVKLGIAERVWFRGWQKNPYPLMAQARATVLCSTYEGFSNTVLESMALGIPVVTSICSSDAEDMTRRGAALGFPVGDHIALRAHFVRLLADEACRAELNAISARYIEQHTVPYSIPQYEELVRDAVAFRHIRQIRRG